MCNTKWWYSKFVQPQSSRGLTGKHANSFMSISFFTTYIACSWNMMFQSALAPLTLQEAPRACIHLLTPVQYFTSVGRSSTWTCWHWLLLAAWSLYVQSSREQMHVCWFTSWTTALTAHSNLYYKKGIVDNSEIYSNKFLHSIHHTTRL